MFFLQNANYSIKWNTRIDKQSGNLHELNEGYYKNSFLNVV